jgi:hypothetical protein
MRIAAVSALLMLGACAGGEPVGAGRLVGFDAAHALGGEGPPTEVAVRVEDASGRAVAGAQVLVVGHYADVFETPFGGHGMVGWETVAEGRSNADGRFAASPRLARSVNALKAAAIGDGLSGVSAFAPLDAGGGRREFVIVLRAGTTYAGRVVDSTGRVVPDATVVCAASGNEFELRATPAADGSFRCGPFPASEAPTARLSAVHRGPVRTVWSDSVSGAALSAEREVVLLVDTVSDTPAERK